MFIKHHQYTAFTHTYSGIYRGFFDSSLCKGLNTTAVLFSLYISSPFDLRDSLWHGGADHCWNSHPFHTTIIFSSRTTCTVIVRNSWAVLCYRKVGVNCVDWTWEWVGRQLPQENRICVIYLSLLWYAELGNWYYTYEYIWYAVERTIVNLILHVIANMHLTAQGFWCYQMLLTHYTRRVNSWNVLYRHSYVKFKCLFPKIV
jgi:hypothetical protein